MKNVVRFGDVFIEYTGYTYSMHKGHLIWSDGESLDLGYEDYIDYVVYDENGNKLYSNYSTIEEAEKAVKVLELEGEKAVIGPKAPWKSPKGPIPNQDENAAGVYIVKEPKLSLEEGFSKKLLP